ncbi:MAG TPA: 4Fe-4S dicluster domain-containing protein [Gemmatimonadaceae bacterium]|nr:4Fe-4S dicluster domain-containing protein [Gemmatimonadaceae bacterium]
MSIDTGSAGVKRRDFLKVLGAAGAAGATIGCGTDDVGKLIPYLESPDNTVPGVSNYYATTCRECAAGCGVIAEVRDGRAIKLEGNPEHPLNRGALCSTGQAALQGLYNPDRYRGPMAREGGRLVPTTWEKALATLGQQLTGARGNAGATFINQSESGSFPVFLDQWLSAFGLPAHLSYDADLPASAVQAHREVYGVAWPTFDFTATRLVVSIGADFLDNWGASVPQQLSWGDARAKLADAPRLVYIGARRSLTGLNADEWIAARPGSELLVAQALFGEGDVAQAAQAAGVSAEQLQRLATELRGGTPSLALAGTSGPDATEVALAAARFNQARGAVGTSVKPAQPVLGFEGGASYADVRALVQRMNAGQVPVLMVRGANPAFTTPRSLGFADAMGKVPFKVSFSSFPDETSELCDLVLPDHHALETWGIAQPVPGTISLQQPTMTRPVFNTRPTGDVLMAVSKATAVGAGAYAAYADYAAWIRAQFPGGPSALAAALPTGIARGSVPARSAPASAAAPVAAPAAPARAEGELHLVVYPSPLLGTGSGGNKPWLQELADPVTKISWQSWVEIHPLTARRLAVVNGDHLTVQTATGSVTAPAYLYLGIQPDTVAIALGRGHTAYGRYAKGIGINPLDILAGGEDSRSGALSLVTTARVTKAAGHADLVTTEGSARQHGRNIAQAVAVSALAALQPAELQPGGRFGSSNATENAPYGGVVPGTEQGHGGGHDIPGLPSSKPLPGLRSPIAADAQGELADSSGKDLGMYDQEHWSGMAKRRWAMTVDLARCTGCSACVTACYAENNIPTVGAPWQGRATSPVTWDETPGANIVKGREMTWIRLERYFEGGEDGSADFETRFIPMLCQHCGNAPCEPVCPVYATYHSPDGLNVQVYNRCVGTRYCSNNCPYKVRYFNWFGFGEPNRRQYAFPEPLNWQLNPDVTVRGKGVMEKCTFCVQRIREAENRAKLEGRPLEGDEFTVACAQACPSRAITFGDAADASWSVAQLAVDRRAYHVFEELNTFTAVVYLKKVNHAAPSASPTA